MKVNVRLYKSTGYNLIDRPDSALTIETLAQDFMDIPDIFVVQNHGLDSITIPLSYQQSRYIDYIRLTSHNPTTDLYNPEQTGQTETIYYVLTAPPQMINEHDCKLYIKEDYIPTFGLRKADFISGQINIAHVPVDDWRYSTTEKQERFAPPGLLTTQYLEIEYDDIKDNSNYDEKVNIVNATVDLLETAASKDALINTGFDIFDPNHSGNVSVAVPQCKPVNHQTDIYFKRTSPTSTSGYETVKYKPPYGVFFVNNNPTTIGEQNTLSALRSLGLFDVITDSYDVDGCYIHDIIKDNDAGIRIQYQIQSDGSKKDISTNLYEWKITRLDPIFKEIRPNIPNTTYFDYEYRADGTLAGYKARNKAVYFGQNNAYYLVSKCTGNMMVLAPEDTMTFPLGSFSPSESRPYYYITADLRAGGAPKILPVFLNRTNNVQMMGVNGMSWANHQNNFLGHYGTDLSNNNFKMGWQTAKRSAIATMGSALVSATAANIRNIAGVATLAGGAGALGSAAGLSGAGGALWSGAANVTGLGYLMQNAGLQSGAYPLTLGIHMSRASQAMLPAQRVMQGASNTMFEAGRNIIGNNTNAQLGGLQAIAQAAGQVYAANQNYHLQKAQLDYANAMATTATEAPIIEFPYSESSREIYGNYFTIYRTLYTEDMMRKLDDFYDLWGYQVGGIEITKTSDEWFNNRQYFNYLSMNNVALKYLNMSMEEKEGLAADLGNVRLWHNNILPKDWNITMGNSIKST